MPEAPLGEVVAFDGPIFGVVRETWAGVAHPYDVVRHPGAAAVLPITPEGDALLVRQLRPAVRRRLVEIPAGLLDRPDEDALGCAARELQEETGHRHRSIEFLGGIYTTPGFSDEYVHLFWALVEPRPVAEPEVGIELVRRPFGEMVMGARAGRVRDAKTALAILLADARGVVRVR
jgi:ADP-ribose pyrophosphatase